MLCHVSGTTSGTGTGTTSGTGTGTTQHSS